MSMNLFVALEKLINEHGSAVVLKERLSLAADKFKNLEDENQRLKETNESLEKQVIDLASQLKAHTIPKDFIEKRGVLFRRNANGKIDEDAYCPTCKTPMSSLMGATPFKCKKCGFVAGFTGIEIKGIVAAI